MKEKQAVIYRSKKITFGHERKIDHNMQNLEEDFRS